MEFISAEQFLKEDKEVQEVFINWWKPSTGDLFKEGKGKYALYKAVYISPNNIGDTNVFCALSEDRFYKKEKVVPLLTEGQLRQFIEDKTGYRMLPDYNDEEGYSVWLYRKKGELKNKYRKLGGNLLQAYWEVAVQIAREKK